MHSSQQKYTLLGTSSLYQVRVQKKLLCKCMYLNLFRHSKVLSSLSATAAKFTGVKRIKIAITHVNCELWQGSWQEHGQHRRTTPVEMWQHWCLIRLIDTLENFTCHISVFLTNYSRLTARSGEISVSFLNSFMRHVHVTQIYAMSNYCNVF